MSSTIYLHDIAAAAGRFHAEIDSMAAKEPEHRDAITQMALILACKARISGECATWLLADTIRTLLML